MSLDQYFGENGPFAEACERYCDRYECPLPAGVLEKADLLGEGSLAWLLGFCFAEVLNKRAMSITAEDLELIAKGKITQVSPAFFVDGFHFHAERKA